MPLAGFEPTIPVFKRAKTFHALDRAASVTGRYKRYRGNEYTRNNRRIVGRVVFNVAHFVSRNVGDWFFPELVLNSDHFVRYSTAPNLRVYN
jgi:hypothetical protein